MSDSPDSEDSIPSLSSYPPAFVSLITAFIRRAEEAETRAHKALEIIKAKDEQVIQLQQRMEVLEKIACRLEEVMVPPLDLPKSPSLSIDEVSSSHPRDVNNRLSHRPLEEKLYNKYNKAQEKVSASFQDTHNCYEKCQNLIDGLERSNCQLREALAAESQQRVKDHEQYIAALAKMTQAFKDLQNKHHNDQHVKEQNCMKEPLKELDETPSISMAAGGDTAESESIQIEVANNGCPIANRRKNAFNKEDLKKKVELAENILSVLQNRLEKRQNKNNLRSRNCDKSGYTALSKRSLSSNLTVRSPSSLKLKRVHISSHCFLNALKKQNKKLKMKYHNVCEKFTESLSLCEKLKKQLFYHSQKNRKNEETKVSHSTQTEGLICSNRQDRLESSRSNNILQGRLEAAAKVMAKQCKQIQDLQKQLGESLGQVDSLRKRLARAEANTASKYMLVETTQKQLQDLEKVNLALSQEVQQIRDSCSCLRQELARKTEECIKIKQEKENCETDFKEMKESLETKLMTLTTALQQREHFNNLMTEDLQNKLCSLRGQFVDQINEASDRLVAADFKIQELYLGIESFLKLLFTLNSPSSELTPSSQAQAVQVASDILQISPGEVQTILHSSRCDMRVSRWLKECNRMVHEKVFAKDLGNLLIDAVLEAKIA